MDELSTAEHFAKYGWAYVPNLVDKFECEMLTENLFLLKKEKKTKKDHQCPVSDSIYGEKHLDKLLENLCPKMSKLVNIPLLPTYSYSRIYYTNEELKIHKDRPSCEISATITLGHDKNSDIWPIFFSKNRTEKDTIRQVIDIGGAVIYRGCDIWHWRQNYKGKWQTQVFVHYVDANGPNADQAYDGRESLGSKKRINPIRE